MINWVGYGNRTWQQIKQVMITRVKTLVPELTDLSNNNVLIRMLEMWAQVSELLHYYLDNLARESFVSTARSMRTLIKIAESRGVSVPLANPAYVSLVFYSDSLAPSGGQFIPKGTIVTPQSAPARYNTKEDCTILAGQNSVNVVAIQYEQIQGAEGYDATGTPKPIALGVFNERFYLPANIVDGSVKMYVDDQQWVYVNSFYASALTMNNGQSFTTSLDNTGASVVVTGDGVIGAVPSGQVRFDYQLTYGELGNVAAGSINTLQSSVTLAVGINSLSVDNPSPAWGGRMRINIETLRKYLTYFSITDKTTILLSDFKAHALAIAGVVGVNAVFKPNCTVELSLLTKGGITTPVEVLQDIYQDIISTPAAMGVTVVIQLVDTVVLNFTIRLNLLGGYDQDTTQTKVGIILLDYFTAGNLPIGKPVVLSDLYQLIEEVDGVVNSEILDIKSQSNFTKTYDPLGTSVITASVNVFNNFLAYWTIAHIQRTVAGDTYQVFINGVYRGQLLVPIGASNSLQLLEGGISITYNTASVVGSTFDHYTIAYQGTRVNIASNFYPSLGTITFV